MADPTDIPGILGGSRLLDQPNYRAEVQAWQAFLDTPAPVLVEVGFDHGRRLSRTALLHPGWAVAGLEIRRRRVDEARERSARMGTDNLFLWRVDARAALGLHTPEASVDIVEALFPDPWWKPAHRAKRLLISERFLRDVARVLRPGGVLHLATDVAGYAQHMAALLSRSSLVTDPEAARTRPVIDAVSRRAWSCRQQGHPVHTLWARRR